MKLLFLEDYLKSPHLADGIDDSKEVEIRNDIVNFIMLFGNFFPSHEIIAKAVIIFHAYSHQVSFKKFDRYVYASAAVFLASKIEDSPQSIETTVKQYLFLQEYKKQHLLQMKKQQKQQQQQLQQQQKNQQLQQQQTTSTSTQQQMEIEKEEEEKSNKQQTNNNIFQTSNTKFQQQFSDFQDKLDNKKINESKLKIIDAESQLLKLIGFDVDIELPYKYIDFIIFRYQNILGGGGGEEVNYWSRIAKNFVNDSLRTTMSLYYQPYMIALGAMQLTSLYLNKQIPDLENKKWYQILQESIQENEIFEVVEALKKLYKDRSENSNSNNKNTNNNSNNNNNNNNNNNQQQQQLVQQQNNQKQNNLTFNFYYENMSIPQYNF